MKEIQLGLEERKSDSGISDKILVTKSQYKTLQKLHEDLQKENKKLKKSLETESNKLKTSETSFKTLLERTGSVTKTTNNLQK